MLSSESDAPYISSPQSQAHQNSEVRRICVIDLGTNSFHALIVDLHPDKTFTAVGKRKEMVRLGEGGMGAGLLTEEAMARGIATLIQIQRLAQQLQVMEFHAFATSAIREARNGALFIEDIFARTGIQVHCIDGNFEAALIYEGVRHTIALHAPSLLVDIGGGSTEFIIGTPTEALYLTSLKVGAERMREQFNLPDPPSSAALGLFTAHLATEMAPVFEAAHTEHVSEIIGSSGTLETLANVYLHRYGSPGMTVFQQTLDSEKLHSLATEIMYSAKQARAEMAGMDPRRVDQIVAGAALVKVLLEHVPARQARLSPAALREGMVYYLAAQKQPSGA